MIVNAYCRKPAGGLAKWELQSSEGSWDCPTLERDLHLVTREAERTFGIAFRPPVLLSITTESVIGTIPSPSQPPGPISPLEGDRA